MATINTRAKFKDYCLRRLGWPVIDINVDDDQVQDRIDDALQYWQDYHFDGLQKVYWIKVLTQDDINNQSLTGNTCNRSRECTRGNSMISGIQPQRFGNTRNKSGYMP